MPSLLSGPRQKAGSEPHSEQPRPTHAGLSNMHIRDRVATLTDQLPDPPADHVPPGAHPMFIPPGLAPAAIGGDVEGVQGSRHSALGLEGLEARFGGSGGGGGGAEMQRRGRSESMGTTARAPTVGGEHPLS